MNRELCRNCKPSGKNIWEGKSDTAIVTTSRAGSAAYFLAYDSPAPDHKEQGFYMSETLTMGNIAEREMLEQLWQTEAVTPPHEQPEQSETYGHSLRVIGKLGALAAANMLETPEGLAVQKELREEYESSIAEMIKTDVEFRGMLEINREDTYTIKDGKVLAYDGKTPVADMVATGVETSVKEALKDKRMQPQANRDAADLRNAITVDAMEPGMTRIAISMDPKEAMARDGIGFWESLGYREGLAFIQWYTKVDAHTVVAGTYSVDQTNLEAFRAVWAKAGGVIPEGLPTDRWLDCAIMTECNVSQARELVKAIRNNYYHQQGLSTERYGINDFMALNQAVTNQTFEQLYVPMATARETKVKNATIQAFVTGLLANSQSLKDDVVARLNKIQANAIFDNDDARCIESLIRYGVVERLRPGLERLRIGLRPVVRAFVAPPEQGGAALAYMMAGNVINGTMAGRSYGGCGGSDAPGKNAKNAADSKNPQDAYGGKANEGERIESEAGECLVETNNCYCCALNSDGTPRKNKMTVLAVIDKTKTIHCLRTGCGAWLAEGGDKKYKGRIAQKAEQHKNVPAEDKADEPLPPVTDEDESTH